MPLAPADLRADVAVFESGAALALKYETNLRPADLALIDRARLEAQRRRAALASGKHPRLPRAGSFVAGYVSRVDGSAQPFGVVLPRDHDPTKPSRLDVVLHGSMSSRALSFLQFMSRFGAWARPGDATPAAPPNDFIELHPMGRVENCYRWAGEADVFEAIEAVRRRYNIDPRRIVLRGMSMGASGTWHLGLKYPDRFAALGPYCGYVDTYRFSHTPIGSFVRVKKLRPVQDRALRMLDSVDYAANAGLVPAIGAIGDKDVFFDAHVIMGHAMRAEGIEMVNLISPGTGHVIDPVTHAEQMRRIALHTTVGVEPRPRRLRFVTWTLKYPGSHWVKLLGLKRHYDRAEIDAHLTGDNELRIDTLANITRFALLPPATDHPLRITIGKQTLAAPASREGVVLACVNGEWRCSGGAGVPPHRTSKRPGLQGPIDDAFASSFLCVRGTGRPWNRRVHGYALAALDRFADDWERYMRGPLPVIDDTAVTPDHVAHHNLILFGDPGSNRWIKRVLPRLPIHWSPTLLSVAGVEYDAAHHTPALVYPNPLPTAGDRYIVVNVGHSFGRRELSGLNYLLFPRLGDWAVLDTTNPDAAVQPEDRAVRAGFFDEAWCISD
ncbi:MAG: prolyl oligopeptidase family serine peptidase [Planctomycetes bacterium]|nr:prolyl oligopeptidase family serine peptidase [Planctomycetota bacterium]